MYRIGQKKRLLSSWFYEKLIPSALWSLYLPGFRKLLILVTLPPVISCILCEEIASLIGTSWPNGENLLKSWSYWIPRTYREAIVGDILEDCHELRALGKSEWRIRIHIIWQLAWALILLRPAAFMDALKRILSTK